MPEEEQDTRSPLWAQYMEMRLRIFIAEQAERTRAHVTEVVSAAVASIVSQLQDQPTKPGPATGFAITIGGIPVTVTPPAIPTVSLSVDAANEEITITWLDDKLEPTPNFPEGATFALVSSTPTVASVGTATAGTGTGEFVAPLAFMLAGDTTVTVTPVDGSGNPLPGFTPASIDLDLTPGTATSILVGVDNAAPVPAPLTVPSTSANPATPAEPTGPGGPTA